jgi:hypothetical protein
MFQTRKRRPSWTAIAFAAGLLCGSVDGFAAWPSGSARTLPGEIGFGSNTMITCTPFSIFVDSSTSDCAFVSDWNPDADSMWGGVDAYAYVDFHVSASGSGKWTSISACRQSWSGGAFACGGGAMESDGTPGIKNLGGFGFSSIPGTANENDYFFMEITTTETIDQIYGTAYGG